GGIDWDREADALGLAALTADLGVDPDHAAARVEQRASGVAVVDRRVGLDRVDELEVGSQGVDRAMDRRDNTHAERVLVAERAADRGHGRPDRNRRGVAERNRYELG